MTLAWKRSCQGCTQYCELLTCVLVSPTPQVSADHIDDAVDEDEEADMKCRKGNNGVSIIKFHILRVNFEESLHPFWNTFQCPRTISPA